MKERMTPQERLKEIEDRAISIGGDKKVHVADSYVTEWLIARVKQLEKTLEEIKIVDLRDDIPKDHLLALLAMYSAKAILALAGDE